MTANEIIKLAIQQSRLIQFTYGGGIRVVEPHMLAYNEADHFSLSAWFIRGHSDSGGPGWREYLMSRVQNVVVLDESFHGPRRGYKRDGGQKFSRVEARL